MLPAAAPAPAAEAAELQEGNKQINPLTKYW